MDVISGIPASPGVATGPANILERISLDIPALPIPAGADADSEMARYRTAVAVSCDEVSAVRDAARSKLKPEESEIFDAHLLMLEDPALEDAVAQHIRGGLCAESAAAAAVRDTAAQFDAMDDEYFRARAADVRDIGRRILKNLVRAGAGCATESASVGQAPHVLVAEELMPSDAAALDAALTKGIVTEKGGATSHASIFARSLGIPCVAGVAGVLQKVVDGDVIALDGESGKVYIHPDDTVKKEFAAKAERMKQSRATALKLKDEPAVTRGGRRVAVYANAGSAKEVETAVANGAEGIGLFRTEFLFIDRKSMPSEDEQSAEYAAAARAARGRPVTFRLLDIGGDKPAAYLNIPKEENPFLGLRAVRLLLERPEVLRVQLRAIYRASDAGDVSIMIPMVADISELRAVKEIAASCMRELEREGKQPRPLPIGIMIEVPAAALAAESLAAEADFFSIGTNDLTQYCMAADRGNAAVAHLYQPAHPAVMALVRAAVSGAQSAGIKVSVCGESASDAKAIPALVEAGVDILSVAPAAPPDVKQIIRNIE